MDQGSETVVTFTGYGDWHYIGAADELWTASYLSRRRVRYTATMSADPASAAGRMGHALRFENLLQGGDAEPGHHYHATGPAGAKLVITEGI